jgi:hypothetical protein
VRTLRIKMVIFIVNHVGGEYNLAGLDQSTSVIANNQPRANPSLIQEQSLTASRYLLQKLTEKRSLTQFERDFIRLALIIKMAHSLAKDTATMADKKRSNSHPTFCSTTQFDQNNTGLDRTGQGIAEQSSE